MMTLPNTIENCSEEQIIALCENVFPNAQKYTLEQLKGGATNSIFKVTIVSESSFTKAFNPHFTDDKNIVLVRIYGNATENLVDREKEIEVLQELNSLNQAPPVYCKFKNGFIVGYFPGTSLQHQVLGKYSLTVAKRLAEWHKAKPSSMPFEPTLFPTMLRWLKEVKKGKYMKENHRSIAEKLNLEQLEKEIHFWRPKMEQFDVVFCHNDLAALNIIQHDQSGSLNFIDYEYCGYNYRAYDIANHFCEYAGMSVDKSLFPSQQEQHAFLLAYLKQFLETNDISPKQVEKLHLEVIVASLMSNLFWGIWALYQAQNSKHTDIDFINYAEKRIAWYWSDKENVLQKIAKAGL